MLQSMSLSLSAREEKEYDGWSGLRADCALLGLDGVEGIWGGEEISETFPKELLVGYHLTFFPDWLDFYRGDEKALTEKYGSVDAARAFYGCRDTEGLLELYRADLERARALGAKYVVFHVSDVSVEEGYTYRWLHSDEEVIDASVRVINDLLADVPAEFEFLVENQWWPGFTFTDPAKTERLLNGIHFARKGIVLDTGHLMNTEPVIRIQAEGLEYIRRNLDRHGQLAKEIRAVHLHQSLSGNYVRETVGALPTDLPAGSVERFGASYAHIQRIDRHRPWTHTGVSALVEKIAPQYLTHELAADGRSARFRAVGRQIRTLNCR